MIENRGSSMVDERRRASSFGPPVSRVRVQFLTKTSLEFALGPGFGQFPRYFSPPLANRVLEKVGEPYATVATVGCINVRP